MLDPAQSLLAVLSGGFVGFTVSLLGGGGSILAVPLLLYVVHVADPHVAIGTSAFAVAAIAAASLVTHAVRGNVRWRCAGIYAAAGVAGALLGSTVGKLVDGQKLLFLFALLMMVVAALTLRARRNAGNPAAACTLENAPRTVGFGAATGVFAGFFGIGGGFLVVPGLVAATGMPLLAAIGSSLVAIAAFGFATAANYAWSGLVDWPLAALFLAGGMVGGVAGALVADRLSARKGVLNVLLAGLLFAIGAFMAWRAATSILT